MPYERPHKDPVGEKEKPEQHHKDDNEPYVGDQFRLDQEDAQKNDEGKQARNDHTENVLFDFVVFQGRHIHRELKKEHEWNNNERQQVQRIIPIEVRRGHVQARKFLRELRGKTEIDAQGGHV
jgi:hypothetical protein